MINPDEFEAGANVTGLVRGEKSGGMVVSVRLNQEDTESLLAFSEEKGMTLSDVARQAIRTFLHGSTPLRYALEISYGTPSGGDEQPYPIRADVATERETFAPPVLYQTS